MPEYDIYLGEKKTTNIILNHITKVAFKYSVLVVTEIFYRIELILKDSFSTPRKIKKQQQRIFTNRSFLNYYFFGWYPSFPMFIFSQ